MPVVRSKVIGRRIEQSRPQKIVKPVTLRGFWAKRNKILIIRGCGGLGDILMHRMMFEDFKRIMPEAEIHFALPKYYHDAVKDHPFIDKLVAMEDIDKSEYIVSYNTTSACGRTEMKLAPFSGPHRSDIWAGHCGVILTNHDMHITLTDEEKIEGRKIIEQNRDRPGPCVVVCPISAMQNKNLSDRQVSGLIDGLWKRGLYALGMHNHPMQVFVKNKIPNVDETRIRIWMAILNQADYVISVDTAALHCAGGMRKPLVGVFTFVNAETYTKYYPTAELIQGTCPVGHSGCYNWGACPCKGNQQLVPCCSNIHSEMILSAVDKMLAKWPIKNSI